MQSVMRSVPRLVLTPLHRAIATVVLLSLVLVSPPTPTTAQTTPTATLSPCKYDVGLGKSKYQVDAECTVIQVPEDYSQPDGKQLDLHVTVLRATGPTKQSTPVFHLEGGPGASAILNFGQSFFSAYRHIREDHDIVLIDQRGTGLSSSLQCTEITDPAITDLNTNSSADEGSSLFSTRMAACLERLAKTTDPAHYTSTVAADDTDRVRQALGYDQIDVYGSSYGTWLAQIYLARHGEHVHAMILDSVAGPWNFYMLASPANAEAALTKIYDLCVADQDCNRVYPDLPGKMKAALARLDKAPARTFGMGVLTGKTYPMVMTRKRFLEVIRSMMYLGANVSTIPKVISDAANGQFSLAAAQAVLGAEVASQISIGYYYSVQCSESLPFITAEEIAKHDPSKFFGSGETTMGDFRAVCNAWRAAELDTADVAPIKSDRPVLIMVGAFDPITSVAFGEETHSRLPNSTLAVFPYQAHGPLVSSKCAQLMAKAFLTAPDKPVDTSCTTDDTKPKFLGAYSLNLVNYTDPNGRFTARIPKGWTFQEAISTDHMAFFASPNGTELLAIGIFNDISAQVAEAEALDAIRNAYGPIDVQFSESVLFVKILQHSLDRPNDSLIGLLMGQTMFTSTKYVWIAAPANVIQAMAVPVAEGIITSVIPK